MVFLGWNKFLFHFIGKLAEFLQAGVKIEVFCSELRRFEIFVRVLLILFPVVH